MVALVLGSFVFQDFELPESIALPCSMAGHLHKLPGGVRIFDATGPDDDEISWSGRFRGASAMDRMNQLKGMTRAGGMLSLSILDLSFSVIISKFTPTIRRPWEVDYTLALTVLSDDTQGIDSAIPSTLDDLVASDITTGLATLGAGFASVAAAVSVLQIAIDAVPSLQEASAPALAPVDVAAFALQNELAAAANAEDEAILGNPLASNPIDTGAANLLATLTALQNESMLMQSGAYLGRACANILNSAG